MKTIFITNGTLLTDDTIKFLSFYRDTIDEIKISFDGRGNDFVRGKGTTKLILSAIEKLDRNNFPWTLNTIINKYNVDYLNEIYDFLENYNPKYWRLDIPFISGRMAENKDEIGIFDMEIIIKRCAKIIKRNIIDTHKSFDLWIYNIYSPGLENYDFAEKTKDIHPCSYNKRNLGIRGLGEVTPCARFLDLKLSSVKGKSIRDAKKDEKYKKFWEIKVGDFKECFDCRYYKICGS
ncbi:MAG: radical SAM protein [Peptoniphilus sp.]|uniref:radical SAM protein n=1 Tax=Peptoniphilus sp. TaxID=1971214 RepID=UPI002A7603E0|nr:radical SAM protein [Peptoniphilus sp.]MDY2986079.1 radical SAM protein [Peptoniphilus sp.]